MTRDEAVARIQEGLSFRDDRADTIISRLQEAQRYLEQGKTLPWFLLQEDAVLALASGDNEIALPTGFLRHARFERLRYTPIDSESPFNIVWKSLDDAIATYGDSDAGGPQVAVLRKTTIRIFPDADIAYSLTWSYYKSAVALTTNVANNEWLVYAPEALIGEAGWRTAMDLNDAAASKKFDAIRKLGQMAVLGEEIEREAGSGPLLMGANN